jgi:hypothetical protein
MRYEEAANPVVAKMRFDKMLEDNHYNLKYAVEKMLDELTRLREVIKHTHINYCTEAYTSRGLHAPECLLYELPDLNP